MRFFIILVSALSAACQRDEPAICRTNAPYDDSKYEEWLAAREKADCDKWDGG